MKIRDEIFWPEISKAHDMIAANNQQSIVITSSSKEASLHYDPNGDCIVIVIYKVEAPKPPTLIAP